MASSCAPARLPHGRRDIAVKENPHMKTRLFVIGPILLAAACSTPPATPAAPPAPEPRAYANLSQLMRAIPFTHSNLIFDAGNEDPEEKKKKAETATSAGDATAAYGNIYAGWQQVENAALALQETANLIMIPGRLCENGKPVPIDQEDFRKWSEGLVTAGQAALDAARSRSVDRMLEVGEAVTNSCAGCHEKYRDTPNQPADRCTP
jgi:hypothetical protein